MEKTIVITVNFLAVVLRLCGILTATPARKTHPQLSLAMRVAGKSANHG
jgi:hypothetical protein